MAEREILFTQSANYLSSYAASNFLAIKTACAHFETIR